MEAGDIVKISLVLDKHEITGDIGAEIVRLHTNPANGADVVKLYPLNIVKMEGAKVYYSLDLHISEAGMFKYGLRIFPDNKNLPHRMDFAYVRWLHS